MELDWPIVIFGGDFTLENSRWKIDGYKVNKKRANFNDINKIVENVYRVLLSRSRIGMTLFIPDNTCLDGVYAFFKDMGIDEL